MLIYIKNDDCVVSLNNSFHIDIDYNSIDGIFDLILYPANLGYYTIYSSSFREECISMLNSILYAYEQGLKVFRI